MGIEALPLLLEALPFWQVPSSAWSNGGLKGHPQCLRLAQQAGCPGLVFQMTDAAFPRHKRVVQKSAVADATKHLFSLLSSKATVYDLSCTIEMLRLFAGITAGLAWGFWGLVEAGIAGVPNTVMFALSLSMLIFLMYNVFAGGNPPKKTTAEDDEQLAAAAAAS